MDLMLSFLPWYISRSRLLWSFPKSFRRSKIFKTVSATTRGFTHIRYIISSTHLATDYCSSNMPSGYCSSSSGRNTSGFSGTGRGNQNTRPSHSSYSRDTTQSGSRSGSDRYTGSSSRPAYGSSTSRSSYTRDNTYSSYGPGFSTSQSHSRYGRDPSVRRPRYSELEEPPAPHQPIFQPDEPEPNAPTYPTEGGTPATRRHEFATPLPNPSVWGWDLEFDDVGRDRETEEPFRSRRGQR